MDTRQWAYGDGCTPGQIQSFVPASSARVKDLDVRRPAFRTYSIGADKSTTHPPTSTLPMPQLQLLLLVVLVLEVDPGHGDGQIRQAKCSQIQKRWVQRDRWMDGWPPSFSSLCPCNTMRQAHAPPIHAHIMDRWAAITAFQGPNTSRFGALLEEAPMPIRQHQVPLRRKP